MLREDDLADLLQVIEDIEDTLGESQVEMLSSDTYGMHGASNPAIEGVQDNN